MRFTAMADRAVLLPVTELVQPEGATHPLLRELARMALLTVAWLAATAWVRPLMLPDEGRYVAVAWEMLHSGQWLTPTLDGLPFFHKPPLFYWITAASLKLFGMGELAARAAPILGATLGALSLYAFTHRWRGQALARRVLLVLAVQPLFFVG
jgi:4-amino-4-deoxy-L-arabinose transferase-like glycosyltransferase